MTRIGDRVIVNSALNWATVVGEKTCSDGMKIFRLRFDDGYKVSRTELEVVSAQYHKR